MSLAAPARHAIVGATLLALTILHFTSPASLHELHNLLFKLTFVPLILAGLWFPVRGAMLWAGLTTGAYLVHVFGQLHHAQPLWAWLGDIALYNVVTFTTSFLSQRREEARLRAEQQAGELERSTAALLRAEETLRHNERLRSMGELAAGMAHEIRNPLGGIRGAAEVLRRGDTPHAAREEFGELLEQEIARLDRVVENFLRFARPPAGDENAVCAPREVADAVLLLVAAEARSRRVATGTDIPPGLRARVDPDLLRQILLNLALNALHAQPDGGRLDIRGARDGDTVRIEVVDTGGGVPDALRDRLFDPYVSGRSDGTGLGLAIAARIAQNVGGAVELTRTAPAGSTFTVTLPAA